MDIEQVCNVDIPFTKWDDEFVYKTDKDGYFKSAPKPPKPGGSGTGKKLKIAGKMVAPQDVTVSGTFIFNGTKKTFPTTKAGVVVNMGTYLIKDQNTASLEGEIDPPTPNVSVKFDVTFQPCV